MPWEIALAIGLCLFSAPSHAAIAQVFFSSKTATAGATTLTSNSVTDTNTNDLIILECASQFDFTVKSFKTPTTTSGLTLSTGIISQTQIGGAALFYACTGSGGFSAKTFTCNWLGTGPASASVVGYSGTKCTNATPSAGIGSSKACNGTTGTTGACTNTTSANNSLVIGDGNDPDNAYAATAGASQTAFLRFNDATNAEAEWYLEQNAITATSGTSVTMSITNVVSGDRWNSTWFELLAASSSLPRSTLTIKNSKLTIQNSKLTIVN